MNRTIALLVVGLLIIVLSACGSDEPESPDPTLDDTPTIPLDDLEDDLLELAEGLEDLDLIEEDLDYGDADLE